MTGELSDERQNSIAGERTGALTREIRTFNLSELVGLQFALSVARALLEASLPEDLPWHLVDGVRPYSPSHDSSLLQYQIEIGKMPMVGTSMQGLPVDLACRIWGATFSGFSSEATERDAIEMWNAVAPEGLGYIDLAMRGTLPEIINGLIATANGDEGMMYVYSQIRPLPEIIPSVFYKVPRKARLMNAYRTAINVAQESLLRASAYGAVPRDTPRIEADVMEARDQGFVSDAEWANYLEVMGQLEALRP